MIKPEQIPLEVIKAITIARDRRDSNSDIMAHALNAWPGAVTARDVMEEAPHVILPLKEPNT